jgi:hypothetical protein
LFRKLASATSGEEAHVDDQPTGTEETALSDESAKRGMPGWVKVFLIIAIVLAVLIIVGLITGKVGPGGPHGPGRHLGFGLVSASVTQLL